jgi:hypothetical protein
MRLPTRPRATHLAARPAGRRIYLGCLADAGDQVREWTEIWVQNVDGLESSLPALREHFSNHIMDERWASVAKTFAELAAAGLIRMASEKKHPLPAFLDVRRKTVLHPSSSEKHWELCLDDGVLQAAGLPAYSTSLYRYLYQRGSSENHFIPVVAGLRRTPARNLCRTF